MAHFAQLDTNNTVINVIVVNEDEIIDNGQASEAKGIRFCQALYGSHTQWRQTSYSATFRKHYAGLGFTYDTTLDAFIPPKPYESWTLNPITCKWQSPVPCPQDDKVYTWDESAGSWEESSGIK